MVFQFLDQLEVAAQIVALKPRHVATYITRAQRPDIGDHAGQDTAAEGAVGDKANAELLAQRQDLALDIPSPQRILDLHGAKRVRGVSPPDCRRAGFADAQMPHLASAYEVAQRSTRGPGFNFSKSVSAEFMRL